MCSTSGDIPTAKMNVCGMRKPILDLTRTRNCQNDKFVAVGIPEGVPTANLFFLHFMSVLAYQRPPWTHNFQNILVELILGGRQGTRSTYIEIAHIKRSHAEATQPAFPQKRIWKATPRPEERQHETQSDSPGLTTQGAALAGSLKGPFRDP